VEWNVVILSLVERKAEEMTMTTEGKKVELQKLLESISLVAFFILFFFSHCAYRQRH
jgi:hypothetical protein